MRPVRRCPLTGAAFLFIVILAVVAAAPRPLLASEPAPRPASLELRDQALVAARAAVSAAPSADGYCRLAETYAVRGVLDAAYDNFQQALRLDRRHARAHEGLAGVWARWGFSESSLSAAHRAVFYAPRRASAHSALGTSLMAIGEFVVARREFLRAQALDPTAAYVTNNLCVLSVKSGELQDARFACERAVALDPSLAEARNNLGLLYGLDGDYARAHLEFMKGGTRAQAAYNLGLVYLSAHRLDDATLAFEAAQQGNPGSSQVRDRLRQTRAMRAGQTR